MVDKEVCKSNDSIDSSVTVDPRSHKEKADQFLIEILLEKDIVESFDLIRSLDDEYIRECLFTLVDYLHRSDRDYMFCNLK